VEAEFSVLTFAHPGGSIVPIGLLLLDPNEQRLLVCCRQDWDSVVEGEDAEALSALSDDMVKVARNLGAAKLLDFLEDTKTRYQTPYKLAPANGSRRQI
jgi:hypothetical protein